VQLEPHDGHQPAIHSLAPAPQVDEISADLPSLIGHAEIEPHVQECAFYGFGGFLAHNLPQVVARDADDLGFDLARARRPAPFA